MKHVIVIPDGAADQPQAALEGRTPLQAARTPGMDALAVAGRVGLTNHVPDALPPGSEVACMSLIGYDPLVSFTGRAPLEAAAQGITLGPDDWAVRCNLVTVRDRVMEDFTAGHVSTAEATALLASAQAGLAADFPALAAAWRFVPGVSYRNLLLYRGGDTCAAQAAVAGGSPLGVDLRTTPPHDLMDKPVADAFPRGTGSRLLTEIMARSAAWLADHPVNRARIAAGKRPATHVWLWGVGRAPSMEPFTDRYGVSATMITAVDLLRGLGALAGWKRREVVGATGWLDTDYAAKGRAAIEELTTSDLVCVHVEAPDEASHQGDVAAKVRAIEEIDAKIVVPVAKHLAGTEHRILVCPDHPTFLATKTHSRGAVPYVMAGSGVRANGRASYDEIEAAASGDVILPGWRLMGTFLDTARASASGPSR
jgi:2,3-bisphosphoglycerate-independent phosphoglycerate mutase